MTRSIPRYTQRLILVSLGLAWPVLAQAQAGPQDNWVLEPDLRWGTNGTDNGQFAGLWGVAMDTQYIYAADNGNQRIQVFTREGVYTNKWGSGGTADGQLNSPCALAVDATNVYVVERYNYRVSVFTKSGTFVRRWGTNGTANGQFNQPLGIAVDTQHVFVADTGNYRVQVFDKAGTFVRAWGSYGSVAGQFLRPLSIAVDQQYVYVIDAYNSRMQVFDKTGVFVRQWSLPYCGTHGGGGALMAGVNVDEHTVYVGVGYRAISSGAVYSYLRAYDKYGEVQAEWAKSDSPMLFPTSVALDNPYVVLGDNANNCMHVFRRIFRTLGPVPVNRIPLVDILSVEQRNGVPIMDVDYLLADGDDATVTVWAAAFVVGSTNAALSLADMVPMRTFTEGTGTNIGAGLSPGSRRRLTWDMEADGLATVVTNYGDVKVSLMAKDSRGLLDLHFLSIPAVGTNVAFTINRTPLQPKDFLPLWFWLLASGDTNIGHSGSQVLGVGGGYDGQILAEGTNTTDQGRSFLYQRLDVREASGNELLVAREGSTPGFVQLWDPRREPPPSGYKVNAFNFVTDPSNGWWVVPLNP